MDQGWNPYESPRTAEPLRPDSPHDRLLTASFAVDQRLAYRVVRFELERRTSFRRVVFLASFATLCFLLYCVVFRLPFRLALAGIGGLVLLHGLQLIVPDVWTRRAMARAAAAGGCPMPLGEYRVEVSMDSLRLAVGGEDRRWALAAVPDAFYLGDLLLVCPEEGVLLPIPRSGDFGEESFSSFCRQFALRFCAQLKTTAPHGPQPPRAPA